MILIQGRTAPAVWLAAVEHVMMLPRAEDFDVFLHISHPTVLSTEDRAVHDEVDSFLKSHGAFGLHTVAETIFPLSEYLRGGAPAIFEGYPEKLRQIQKGRADGNWGSYAYRILRQTDHKGNLFNPLKDLINKINAHGKYRASFELSKASIPLTYGRAVPILISRIGDRDEARHRQRVLSQVSHR